MLQGNLSGGIVGQDASASSIPSPPVVVYSSDGKVIAGWGNPGLIQTGADYRVCRVYVAIGARVFCRLSGLRLVCGQRRWHRAEIQPSPSASRQVPTPRLLCKSAPRARATARKRPRILSVPAARPTTSNSSHTKLNEPADITVDPLPGPVTHAPGDTYIADGYGNHRVVVFDAQGNYVGQWGTTCKTAAGQQSDRHARAEHRPELPAGHFPGATGSGHPHCVVLGNDGLVYVCDRPNSRIQVFNKNCAVPSTTANPEPVCQPVRIINISGFNSASADDRAAILLAGTRGCDMDFWPNIDYLADKSPTSQETIIDVDLGNDNTWVINKASGLVVGALGVCGIAPCPGHNAGHFAFGHMVNVDSQGNVYVGETITGRRIQKFVPADGNHHRDLGDAPAKIQGASL